MTDGDSDALSPAADVFSAGCVVAEVFLDGDALFDLGELLAYRRGEAAADPAAKLARIRDPAARELVAHMVQRDPAERLSAKAYLQRWRAACLPSRRPACSAPNPAPLVCLSPLTGRYNDVPSRCARAHAFAPAGASGSSRRTSSRRSTRSWRRSSRWTPRSRRQCSTTPSRRSSGPSSGGLPARFNRLCCPLTDNHAEEASVRNGGSAWRCAWTDENRFPFSPNVCAQERGALASGSGRAPRRPGSLSRPRTRLRAGQRGPL